MKEKAAQGGGLWPVISGEIHRPGSGGEEGGGGRGEGGGKGGG